MSREESAGRACAVSGSGKRQPVAEKILATAGALFARDGVRAVGVDTIIAESGVAKMSLYRNFPSKDALVAAWLEERDRAFWRRWDAAEASTDDARARLEAILDMVAARVVDLAWQGCPFLNTHVAFPGEPLPSVAVILAHKQQVHDRLTALAESAGARAPSTLADQLQMLIDGAYVIAQSLGPAGPACTIADAGRALIAAGLGTASG
jgi:AcrR family transcriptional regulator